MSEWEDRFKSTTMLTLGAVAALLGWLGLIPLFSGLMFLLGISMMAAGGVRLGWMWFRDWRERKAYE